WAPSEISAQDTGVYKAAACSPAAAHRSIAIGARGPARRSASRADILAVVDDQFSEMRKLDVQVTRTGQVQRQVDAFRQDITELRRQRADVHDLVKDLIKTEA